MVALWLLCGCVVVALLGNKYSSLQVERPPELSHIEQFSLDPTKQDHIVARMLRTFAQHEFENLLLVWSIKSGHFAQKGELISENRWLQALDRYLQLIGRGQCNVYAVLIFASGCFHSTINLVKAGYLSYR